MVEPGRRGFVVATVLLGVGLAVAGAEALVRVGAAASPVLREEFAHYDLLALKVEPHATAGFRPKPGSAWRYANGATAHINSQGFRGPVVTRAKRAGVFRIVLLGGSTTFGWGVEDDQTIDAALRARLGANIEVVNAAFDGYDSFQLLERTRSDVVGLRPDLIVVNAGVNDVRGAGLQRIVDGDPRMLIWDAPMRHARESRDRGAHRIVDRVQHHVYLARLITLLRDRMRPQEDPLASAEPRTLHWDAADYFERNVRRIARIAEAHGAALLFATPPSALRERHSPSDTSSISYWVIDAGSTALYRDTLASRLQRVADDWAAASGRASYVRPIVPVEHFLDDAHLTPEGNRLVAEAWAAAIVRLLPQKATAAEGMD